MGHWGGGKVFLAGFAEIFLNSAVFAESLTCFNDIFTLAKGAFFLFKIEQFLDTIFVCYLTHFEYETSDGFRSFCGVIRRKLKFGDPLRC